MRYIPRKDMPQIASKDLPALITFLRNRGVSVHSIVRNADTLVLHQHVSAAHVQQILNGHFPPKPILISSDGGVLDGNHRATVDRIEHELAWCLLIGLPFHAALSALFSFPRTHKEA
jgi:hypothetical protein